MKVKTQERRLTKNDTSSKTLLSHAISSGVRLVIIYQITAISYA